MLKITLRDSNHAINTVKSLRKKLGYLIVLRLNHPHRGFQEH